MVECVRDYRHGRHGGDSGSGEGGGQKGGGDAPVPLRKVKSLCRGVEVIPAEARRNQVVEHPKRLVPRETEHEDVRNIC